MDPHVFIHNLQQELIKDLPGDPYQYLMAPADRRIRQVEMSGRPRDAAVLILLFQKNHKLETVFIKRTQYPGPHSGQISFPGGKADSSDPDLQFTALRETHEEIGIDPQSIRILGSLTPLDIPVSNFKVHPFIGFSQTMSGFVIRQEEVQLLLTEKLDNLNNPGNRANMNIIMGNESFKAPCFIVGEHRIWGATAMILMEFLEVARRAGLNSGQ